MKTLPRQEGWFISSTPWTVEVEERWRKRVGWRTLKNSIEIFAANRLGFPFGWYCNIFTSSTHARPLEKLSREICRHASIEMRSEEDAGRYYYKK